MDRDDDTVGHLVSRVADALGQQAELHIELAKAELSRDAKALVRDAAPLAVGTPLLALGYVFACVASALALAPWLGSAGGFALVSVLNLLVGGLAVRRSVSHLRVRRILDATVGYELENSAKSLVTALRNPPARVDVSHVR